MKKNQAGFGVVEVLIVLVVIGAIVAGGWYVMKRQKPTKDQAKPAATTPAAQTKTTDQYQANLQNQIHGSDKLAVSCTGTEGAFVNEKIGIAFCYPEGWTTKVYDTPENHIVGSVNLKSPDYQQETGGFGTGTKTGSNVDITVYDIQKLGSIYTSVSSILSGKAQSKMSYTQVTAAKIAGIDGVSYLASYEGPSMLNNVFEHNGKQYAITLEEDVDGPTFNAGQSKYQRIVDTFVFE